MIYNPRSLWVNKCCGDTHQGWNFALTESLESGTLLDAPWICGKRPQDRLSARSTHDAVYEMGLIHYYEAEDRIWFLVAAKRRN